MHILQTENMTGSRPTVLVLSVYRPKL